MDRFLRDRLRDPRFSAPRPSSEFAWYAPVQERLEVLEGQAPPSLAALAGNAPDAAGLAMAQAVGAAAGHPLQVVRAEASKKGPCWTGYHKVAGKADYADGSCAKNSGGSDKKKKKKKKRSKDGGSSSSSSSESDGEGGRRKKKKAKKEDD